jgi:hypothetical protein
MMAAIRIGTPPSPVYLRGNISTALGCGDTPDVNVIPTIAFCQPLHLRDRRVGKILSWQAAAEELAWFDTAAEAQIRG